MHDFLVSAIAFIVLIGIMVVVHELGHFIVAKLCGVRVEAFSVGMGPRLFGVKYGETDYKVCLLPIGGFVKMTGENPGENQSEDDGGEPNPVDDPGSFASHPRWQRMLIALAGPVANFLLAFVGMAFYFGFLNEVPAIKPIVIEWVSETSAAAQAGFKPGDVIQQFDGLNNPSWYQVQTKAGESANQTVPVTVERDGKTLSLALHLQGGTDGQQANLGKAGIFLQFVKSPISVDRVVPNSPAAQAGLLMGDKILAVDGHSFHTLDPLVTYLQNGHGKPITLTVIRNGRQLPPMVAHPSTRDSRWQIGFESSPPLPGALQREPMPIAKSLAEAKDFCVDNSTLIVDVLGRIVTRKVSFSQVSGPVGIARMAGQAAEMNGWYPKFGFAAAISLNLGILNLMPFPILDGGLILLLLIESGLRHDINVVVKERIYQAAFVVLIAFFAFVIFNDVTKLPIFTHMAQ
jgi:regulator of sigma E protease